MIFNSIPFLVFLPIVFIFYWYLKKSIKYQNILLLFSSYIFYGWWDWRFLFLILFSTVLDYVLGIQIGAEQNVRQKKRFLFLSIFANIGFLAYFKYFNFFVTSLQEGLLSLGLEFDMWSLNIILPVGISFYTFQTLSYSIDVYKGKIKPTKDFISFAVFVSFFPQLVAGPIERASHLLPQFSAKRKFDYNTAISGLTLITYGFFKKIVIADRLAIYVNSVFGDIESANTISLSIAMVFFSFQIYADFSGYSLIARGIAKLLGFDLMVNFNKPYLAKNISDFWRRWHISLSSWFRDYVYIPLGGNRTRVSRNYFNLMIVFLLSGLWHGANWTFIIWGAIHGVYQIIYLAYKKAFGKNKGDNIFKKIFNALLVYILVTFAWVFFRADTFSEAINYISNFLNFDLKINLVQLSAEKGPFNLIISFFVIILLFLSYLLPKNLEFRKESNYILFNVVVIFIIFLIGINGKAEFIYFQF